ncbi:MAG: 2-oxoglutarate dehydrogenase complex dihydrolipoyllysine-residue succinyltransferase [Defluviicoccus sp.]|nr:2-oxoglutarate dehydrogenase complex dihydrolipoyllysine-residue succinyltransferase [Defluviicoccus sp.]MDE0385887.1 2-oxoglutarate dehydrogenase complex dihydrolipoyllysine-residue succinyltransferase [Defluviicoccus sp.]
MATQIVVPALGESVTEATVSKWLKSAGDTVVMDEPLVELETDKITLEVPAASAGVLGAIEVAEGQTVEVGAILGQIEAADSVDASPSTPSALSPPPPEPEPATLSEAPQTLSPAVRKLVEERALDPARIAGTGKDGRLTKGDVLAHLAAPADASGDAAPAAAPGPAAAREERVPMTRLRQRIAERLKEAQNTAAMLTTFNEVDMSAVIAVRARLREAFEKRHGVRLGFMSFFVKAAVVALKEVPAVNAEIDGTDIVYKNHYDIAVAVGTDQGLVVPVLRDADALSFAGIEAGIADLSTRAREGRLSMEDLTGGTFTVTNGGVYGSLLSTPILNPPQSGILGMHKIEKRPVVVEDEMTVRPMMYLALSYDHRIVDGREAVTFLVRIKECIEDPERILLEA